MQLHQVISAPCLDPPWKGQIPTPSLSLCSTSLILTALPALPPRAPPPSQSYHQWSPHELEVPVDVDQGQGLCQGRPPAGLGWVCDTLAVAEQEPGRRDIGVIMAVRKETKPTLSRGSKCPGRRTRFADVFHVFPQAQGLAGWWNRLRHAGGVHLEIRRLQGELRAPCRA